MTHLRLISSACFLAVFGSLPRVVGAAEVFISPQFEAFAGYNSNRYQTDEAAGSSFLALKPGLELTIFATETLDIRGLAFHQRNEFLREDFSSSETSGGMIGIRRTGGAWATSISFSGFAVRDAEFTTGDLTQVSCSPELVYTHISGTNYSLTALFGEYRYHQVTDPSDNETVNGYSWSLRPRVRWSVSFPLSLWVEGSVDSGSSDQRNDEYDGYGLTIGADYSPPGRLGGACVLQYGAYGHGKNTGSREDTYSVSVSVSFRANTWAEIQGDAGGGIFWNRDSASSYKQWRVGIGIRLVYDFEIASSST